MKCSRIARGYPILAGLLTVMLTVHSLPARGQTTQESRAERGFGPVYDVAHEVTLTGTVQKVITKHVAGSTAGMHLLVAAPQGLVDAHLGPFLSPATKDALHTGTPVQIVGAMIQVRNKEYFLARELSVGGMTATIRNARGFLVYPHPERVVKTRAAGVDGGAR